MTPTGSPASISMFSRTPPHQPLTLQEEALNRRESFNQFLDCLTTLEQEDLLLSIKKSKLLKSDSDAESESEPSSQVDNNAFKKRRKEAHLKH